MALVDPATRGDPESALRWVTASTRTLADQLTADGVGFCAGPYEWRQRSINKKRNRVTRGCVFWVCADTDVVRAPMVEPQVVSRDDLLTTGEAATLLGVTRQHVVDLCTRGDLAYVTVGTHRRVSRSEVEAFAAKSARMTRDQRRSLWLSYAVAGRLVIDPAATLEVARRNLATLQARHTRGQAALWLAEWDRLLHGPLETLLGTLTSASPRARELRQNSPFAGVIDDGMRQQVLLAFVEHDKRR